MEIIPGITSGPILITNDDGEDDDEEWFLPDWGRDNDYFEMVFIYKQAIDHGKYAYSGGWAEQLAIHIEIIQLFEALDRSVAVPKDGDN